MRKANRFIADKETSEKFTPLSFRTGDAGGTNSFRQGENETPKEFRETAFGQNETA